MRTRAETQSAIRIGNVRAEMMKLSTNSFPQNSKDIETDTDFFKGDDIDDLEDRYLQKKKRRLVSKYTEKRFIP